MTDFLLKLSVQTTRNVFQKGFKFEPNSKLLGKKTNFMKAWNEYVFVNQRVSHVFRGIRNNRSLYFGGKERKLDP